jgi:hypothetical protein
MVDMEPGRRVVEDRPCVVPYLYVHTPMKCSSTPRAANDLLKRREARLQRDLADPAAAGRRLNVTGLARRRGVADDAWIARERARSLLASRMRR